MILFSPTPGKSFLPRVLLIANTGWYLQNFRASLVDQLEKRGVDVILVAPQGEHTKSDFFKQHKFEPLNFERKGRNPLTELIAVGRFLRLLQRTNPDLVLTWTPKPNVYGGIAARLLRIPVIPNVSGLGAVFIRGKWLRHLIGQLYKFAFASAPVVFFQNQEDLSAFVSAGWVTAGKTQRLPGSGVDLQHFQPQALPVQSPFVFLYLGRLLADKGLHELVAAAEQLRRAGRRFALQLAGFIDPGNPAAISREELERWQTSGTVQYLGALSDVRPALAAAHCVVLPSYREGLPRSLLEAAAMARPLIAADVPGCRDVVIVGKNGFLCEPQTTASLAACMVRILDTEPPVLAEMGRAGRQYMERCFSEKLVLDAYMRHCEAVLAGRGKV